MSAIERYEAPVAPATPAVIDDRTWANLERQASVLAGSGLVKPAFRGNANAVMAVALSLHQLGLPVTLNTLSMYDFYEGEARPRVQLLIAFAHSRGHEVWMPDEECDATQAVCYGRRAGEHRVSKVTFTIEQARTANLLGKDNWKKYPADMLKWRAAGRLLKTVLGDTILGLSPDVEAVLAGEAGLRPPPGIDPETGEVYPIIEVGDDPDEGAADAVVPTAPAAPPPADDDAAEGELRNQRSALFAALGEIPSGDRRAEFAAAWRTAGFPRVQELGAHQLPDAWHLVRRYRAEAAMDEAGVPAEARAELVAGVTAGATVERLMAGDLEAVLDECERRRAAAEADAGTGSPPEGPDEASLFSGEPFDA